MSIKFVVKGNRSGKITHSPLLPNSIRALIVGPSNCGKTNVMISLIESPNGLNFQNIYLMKLIKPIKGIHMFTFSDNEKFDYNFKTR